MSISRMDIDLFASFIVGPTSFALVLILLGFVIKQFYANLHYSRARQQKLAKPHQVNLIPKQVPFVFELKSYESTTTTTTDLTAGDSQSDEQERVRPQARRIPIEITTLLPTKTRVYFFWGIHVKYFLDTILFNNVSWVNNDRVNSGEIDLPAWIWELRNFYGNLTSFIIEGAGTSTHQVEIPDSVRGIRAPMPDNLTIPCSVIIVPEEDEEIEFTGDNQQQIQKNSTDIKSLVVAIQLNSLTSRNPMEIKDRFIKTASGFSFRLMPLFLQSDSENPSSADTDDQELFRDRSKPAGPGGHSSSSDVKNNSSSTSENEPFYRIRCTICQTLPVSRAIIPCGHLCTCAHCFVKLKYCPMCRGNIQSYFQTRNESYLNSIPKFMKNTGECKSRKLTWSEYFEEISEQLNMMLGLPEIN